MSQPGKVIVITAPSGTGKSTLIKTLKENFRELHWSVSFTTRKMREGEVDGKHYFFISEEEFVKKKEQGDFIEWAQVHGNYYGTSLGFVRSKVENGYSLLLDLDVQGADSLKEEFSDQCSVIFICPPSLEELEKRLRGRGTESENVIALRLENASKEILRKNDYDHCIVNDSIDQAYRELEGIVKGILESEQR